MAEDIRSLPSAALQSIAVQMIRDVAAGRQRGRPLEDLPWTADLSDCRKLYFDDEPGKVRYRIVYRELPRDGVVEIVEVVAVGPRNGLEVYLEAGRRLGR